MCHPHTGSLLISICARQVDPIQTMSAGKVNLGAFRTYPKVLCCGGRVFCSTAVTWRGPCVQGYRPPEDGGGEYQTIPLDKIEDFGVHCKQ